MDMLLPPVRAVTGEVCQLLCNVAMFTKYYRTDFMRVSAPSKQHYRQRRLWRQERCVEGNGVNTLRLVCLSDDQSRSSFPEGYTTRVHAVLLINLSHHPDALLSVRSRLLEQQSGSAMLAQRTQEHGVPHDTRHLTSGTAFLLVNTEDGWSVNHEDDYSIHIYNHSLRPIRYNVFVLGETFSEDVFTSDSLTGITVLS